MKTTGCDYMDEWLDDYVKMIMDKQVVQNKIFKNKIFKNKKVKNNE